MTNPDEHERPLTPVPSSDAASPRQLPSAGHDTTWDASVFVASTWVVLSLAAMLCTYQFGVNLPYGDSWELVPVVTGAEPLTARWLWQQHNEHRLPLTKLVLVVLSRLTSGDARAGMYLNGVGLAATASILVSGARRLRGRTSYADAFFPIVLLNLGNHNVMVFDFAMNYVATVFLASVLLRIMVAVPVASGWMVPCGAGLCLIGLILTGATGLVPALTGAGWLGYAGWVRWRESDPRRRAQGTAMLAGAAGALLLIGLYFVGYRRPEYHPPSAGVLASLKVAIQFLSLGIGPAGGVGWPFATQWGIAGTFVLAGCAASIGLLTWQAWRRPDERVRAVGLALFLVGAVALALAVGWGRSGMSPTEGFSFRYVTLAVLPLVGLYYVWGAYGPPAVRRLVQFGLFAVVCSALLFNTHDGRSRARQGRNELAPIAQEIRTGAAPQEIASRHRQMLYRHASEQQLAAWLEMLRAARMGPYK